MADTVLEEIIKTVFGANWLAPAVIIFISAALIRFVCKRSLPQYMTICLTIAASSVSILLLSFCYSRTSQPNLVPAVEKINWVIACILVISITSFIFIYRKFDKQLDLVQTNTESGGNKIAAWKELQTIKVSCLTPRQKRIYDKRRLYLRVTLGNTSGAELELDQYQDDKPFYHFTKAIILNFKGNHKAEYDEIKHAEDSCNGDTDPLLHFQIIANRGVAYVINGEFALANDCYQRAIAFARQTALKNSELWLNLYSNYVFNLTRLDPNISLQKCLDVLEDLKQYIDIEDSKQYIGLSNIIIELMRQKNAKRSEIDDFINSDFIYLVNFNLSDTEKCLLEATTARMVCTGRLTPETVIERLSKDIDLFMKLPMPERYSCFKEIDYMFKDLRGPIVEQNQQIRETAHWYIVNQAIHDIDEYRAGLPSEAVYEICYCLKERAGLLKYKPDQYEWKDFLQNMQSAQLIYKENGLLADAVLCYLDIMDEATSERNVDSQLKPVHMDVMQEALREVELALPQLVEHPILYEIYLRLSLYCLAMGDLGRSKEYYRKYRTLGEFSINHFAPWLRGKYSIISLVMLVIGYIETVEKIADKDLSEEIPQIQDWFKGFHDRNGYFEAIVFGRMLGGVLLPLYIEQNPGRVIYSSLFNSGDIKSAWLVIPALPAKIKCNGFVNGNIIGPDGLLSDYRNVEIRFCNVNTLFPEMRSAIERITDMIKAAMPDYLISNEELNNLASNSWFHVSREREEQLPDSVG
ncbi:MAG: hypothetical protein Q4A04_00880 [Eubacteriales bacterium]|nr:hypothetical protein [Eubacteriales bacterium]